MLWWYQSGSVGLVGGCRQSKVFVEREGQIPQSTASNVAGPRAAVLSPGHQWHEADGRKVRNCSQRYTCKLYTANIRPRWAEVFLEFKNKYFHMCCNTLNKTTEHIIKKKQNVGVNEDKVKVKCTVVQALRLCTGRRVHRGSRGIGKGKVHCCTGTEALYRP